MICTVTGCVMLDGNTVNLPCVHIGKEHGGLHVFKAPDKDPIPMILFCPLCHMRHVDRGEFADRPHHTHACQHCGMIWRPAVVATVGVGFLPNFKDRP